MLAGSGTPVACGPGSPPIIGFGAVVGMIHSELDTDGITVPGTLPQPVLVETVLPQPQEEVWVPVPVPQMFEDGEDPHEVVLAGVDEPQPPEVTGVGVLDHDHPAEDPLDAPQIGLGLVEVPQTELVLADVAPPEDQVLAGVPEGVLVPQFVVTTVDEPQLVLVAGAE